MERHHHTGRPVTITSAPESPAQELARRQKRYAIMAVVFVGCFTASALLHEHTAVALALCGVAMATLVLAVIGANIHAPRRLPDGTRPVGSQRKQLGSGPTKRW